MAQAQTKKAGSRLIRIDIDDIQDVWDEAVYLLNPAIRLNDGFEPADVLDALMHSRMNLWLAVEDGELVGAAVTEIINYPQKRSVFILFAGGRVEENWPAYYETMANYAMTLNADCIETISRPGLAKLLKAQSPDVLTYMRFNVSQDQAGR